MHFASVVCAAMALASTALGATLKCKRPDHPYCCTAATSVPELGVSLGIQCTKAPFGHKPKCAAGTVKICCSPDAVDIAGLANICDFPSELLGTLGTLLGPLSGLGGGLPGDGGLGGLPDLGDIPGLGDLPGLGGLGGITGRDVEEAAEEE